VLLDVPTLKVDEIELEVENLLASVSLQAEVLDLLKLKVGADVGLGRVHLNIKGVEAQALLKVQLDNVRDIITRVLETIDANPQILEHVARSVESTVNQVAGGAGQAVGAIGQGAAGAVEGVGQGAAGAVEGVGQGAGQAVAGVGDHPTRVRKHRERPAPVPVDGRGRLGVAQCDAGDAAARAPPRKAGGRLTAGMVFQPRHARACGS